MNLFYNDKLYDSNTLNYINEDENIPDINSSKDEINWNNISALDFPDIKKWNDSSVADSSTVDSSIADSSNIDSSIVDSSVIDSSKLDSSVIDNSTIVNVNQITITEETLKQVSTIAATVCPISINESASHIRHLNEMNWDDIIQDMLNDGLITEDDIKKFDVNVEPAPDVINLDDDIDNNDERFNTYENDIIYKNGLKYLNDDNSRTPELTNAIKELAAVHSDILNMYTNVPFEDWNDIKVNKFKKLLEEYRVKLKSLDNLLDNHQWNTEEQEGNFNDLYWNVIQLDYDSYIRLVERHEHYITYRANRIQLLMTLFQVIDRPTLPHNKSAKMVFNYIARQCDGFPLFGNNKNNKYEEILTAVIHKHKAKFMQDIVTFNTGGKVAYDNKDFNTIVIFYVFCRRMLFDIFNMFTSNNKYNGYEKYKNFYDDFCTGKIKPKSLEAMYNSIRSRIGKTDDYHNVMDQGTFDQQGLFESWWAEDVKWYHDNCPDRFTKDKITRINMIPTNVNACKVYYNGQGVYSNAKFYTGDIIEVCPVRCVGKDSLYSKDMRDIVLEVIPNNKWVIPFGYCQYYTPATYKKDANCSYEWNQKTDNIIIRALCNIPKNTELVMQIVKIS